MMRAAYYEQLGAARDVLRLGEVDVPQVGPGDVRVRVHTSGINPSDVKRRGGQSMATLLFPRVIPHQDGAGVIDAVGAGVSPSRLGEAVWLYRAQLGRPFGTAAEWVVVPEAQAIRLPVTTDFATGACLGVPAMTAHRCVFADGPVTGQTIVVAGGAGAVSHYAIQLAKWGGARVITTVSSPAKGEVAQAAGADHTINYRTEDVVARIHDLTQGHGVDRVVEVAFSTNLEVNARIVKTNGAIASYSSGPDSAPRLPYGALSGKNITVHFVLVYVMSASAHQVAIHDITTCLERGILQHPPIHRFGLEEIVVAHEGVESGQIIGKAMLTLA